MQSSLSMPQENIKSSKHRKLYIDLNSLSEDVVVMAGKELMDKHTQGFFITDLFQFLFPGKPIYHNPERSNSPTAEYNRLREIIRVSNQFGNIGRKTVVLNYEPKTKPKTIPEEISIINPDDCGVRRSGWLKRFLQWIW